MVFLHICQQGSYCLSTELSDTCQHNNKDKAKYETFNPCWNATRQNLLIDV